MSCLHGTAHRRRLGQEVPGRLQQRLACGGEPHGTGGALEERDPEIPLQQPDLLTERRLGDVQPLGGPPEVQFLGNGDESGKVT